MLTRKQFEELKKEELRKLCEESNAELPSDSIWYWEVINNEIKVVKRA